MRWKQLRRGSVAVARPDAGTILLAHELVEELAVLSPMAAPMLWASCRIVAEWLAAGVPPGLVRQVIAREALAQNPAAPASALPIALAVGPRTGAAALVHPLLRDPQLQRAAWLANRRPRSRSAALAAGCSDTLAVGPASTNPRRVAR